MGLSIPKAYLLPVVLGSLTFALSSHAKNLDIDLSQTSVSGLSSGGYMATQFHLSHAETIVGAGIVAAGSYYCANNSIMTALGACVNKVSDAPIDPFEYYKSAQKSGLIAPENAIENDKVWLLHGTLDTRIVRPVANVLHQQYQQWLKADNLVYISDKAFAHVFPTKQQGGQCTESASPFIGNCDYDAAGEILKHIYPKLNAPVETNAIENSGKFISYKQAELANISEAGMNETGFAFVPNSCLEGESCKLHISFHGCNQSIDNVNDSYAKQAGFNEWAASNNMVVLYPQTEKSTMMPMNPQACWDWWGYTGENYANKEGKQIQAIYETMQQLSTKLVTQ